MVCPQKLDERNKRVKTDALDAEALCLKLDRFVQGNGDALALSFGAGMIGYLYFEHDHVKTWRDAFLNA